MAIHNKSRASLFLLSFIFTLKSCSEARLLLTTSSTEFIRTSCTTTIYPSLCFDSLTSYASTIQNDPKKLAKTALSVSLNSARSTSAAMKTISKSGGISPRVAAAMNDCMETVCDSVDELMKSMDAIAHLGGKNLAFQINSIQTWVSAALTDDDTCLDGFDGPVMDGDVKTAVRKHILNVSQLTSNALALVNDLVSAQSSVP